MIKFNYSMTNVFKKVKPSKAELKEGDKAPVYGRVAVRVIWEAKKCIVDLITGVYVEKSKWDEDLHKAKKGTTHHVRNMTFTASEINERIAEIRQAVETFMDKCQLKGKIPTTDQLKKAVSKDVARDSSAKVDEKQKSVKTLLDEFLKVNAIEKNWDNKCKEKYIQAYHHLIGANPNLKRVDQITIETMHKLKQWYIDHSYKNRTANKQSTMLKAFLRWINDQEGYSIPSAVLNFKTNFKVIPRTVTRLTKEELDYFANFPFKETRLAHARDLWCFMAYTSLRYSDLRNLMTGNISDNCIHMVTQKTSDHINIPLKSGAMSILNRYKGKATADGHVFDVISNQKLNDYVKEAAKEAGLDRTIVETYIIGSERKEVQHKFYEIISCHAARRTYVSCSLELGISAQSVMKSTGHKGYATMKPYIETSTERQAQEMERWNDKSSSSKSLLSKIIAEISQYDESRLQHEYEHLKLQN